MNEYCIKYGYPNGWPDHIQHENFFNMLDITRYTKIPVIKKSCLDVGCGTGDLYFLLKYLGCEQYIGLDQFEPSIEIARQRYPQGSFIRCKLEDLVYKHDYVFASGVLSCNSKDDVNELVYDFFNHAIIGCAFNFISEPTEYLTWFEPDEILEFCEDLTSKIGCITQGNQTTIYLCR